jgi:hypothetical protein
MQNGTTFYLLNFLDHSYTMSLNIGSMVLNQLNLTNLIKAKEKTLSLPNPPQNLLVKSNLPWKMRDPRKG